MYSEGVHRIYAEDINGWAKKAFHCLQFEGTEIITSQLDTTVETGLSQCAAIKCNGNGDGSHKVRNVLAPREKISMGYDVQCQEFNYSPGLTSALCFTMQVSVLSLSPR